MKGGKGKVERGFSSLLDEETKKQRMEEDGGWGEEVGVGEDGDWMRDGGLESDKGMGRD